MAETFVIRLDLITKPAKAALRRLRGDRKKTRETARSRIATATRKRAKQVAGFFTGLGAVRRLSNKMRGAAETIDPWVGAMVPHAAALQQFVDEKVGFSAKARHAARLDTVRLIGENVGHGANIEDAKEVFRVRNTIRQQEERGRNVVRQTLLGPDLEELAKAYAIGFAVLSGRAWSYIGAKIFD